MLLGRTPAATLARRCHATSSLGVAGGATDWNLPSPRSAPLYTHSHQRQSPAFQSRSKHSKTQIKRLFKKNPARKRIEDRRNGLAPGEKPPEPKSLVPAFPPVFEPEMLPNGWSAPPPETVVVPKYPFKVTRTGNKPENAVGFLPVYSDYRLGGTKSTTIVRKVSGDRDAFLTELRAVLQLPVPKNAKDDKIWLRANGTTIEIDGNHVPEVKSWLAGLGF